MVRGLRRAALAAALAAAVVGVAAATGQDRALRGRLAESATHSRALERPLPFRVYLPPRYRSSGLRYPVVYFLHGLPASPSSFRDIRLITGAIDRLHRRAIVVAPRGADYDDDDPEYLDRGPGHNWETAIGDELPAFVDAHYRTIRSPRARALIGISAGGYGAALVGLHRTRAFGVVESWSGYFHPTDPAGTRPLRLATRRANVHASIHALVAGLRGKRTLFAFYVGSRDSRFRAENIRLDRELRAARVRHVFRVYRGGHEPTLWHTHAVEWLDLALDHLATAR